MPGGILLGEANAVGLHRRSEEFQACGGAVEDGMDPGGMVKVVQTAILVVDLVAGSAVVAGLVEEVANSAEDDKQASANSEEESSALEDVVALVVALEDVVALAAMEEKATEKDVAVVMAACVDMEAMDTMDGSVEMWFLHIVPMDTVEQERCI